MDVYALDKGCRDLTAAWTVLSLLWFQAGGATIMDGDHARDSTLSLRSRGCDTNLLNGCGHFVVVAVQAIKILSRLLAELAFTMSVA